jgi:hypothetical protein
LPNTEREREMRPSAEQIVAVLPPHVVEAAEQRIKRQRDGCRCFWDGLVIRRGRLDCPVHGTLGGS